MSRPRGAAALLAIAAVLSTLALAASPAAAEELTLPSGFRDETLFSGLEEPTNIRFASGGEVFVAEKTGTILVYSSLADPIPEVFAELSPAVFDKGDRGLLGLALAPGFGPAHPYVYALYTFDHVFFEDAPGEYPHWGDEGSPKGDDCVLPPDADVDDCPVSGRLVKLTAEFSGGQIKAVTGGDPDHPTAPHQDVLLEDWCQQDSTHSVGDLEFGPEGALYVSGGDGAGYVSPDYGQIGWPHPNMCGDPPGGFGVAPPEPGSASTAEGGSLRSQDVLTPEDPVTHDDPTSLDGSLLRIDPETGEGWPTNPLSASSDANARRILATGFRNPFRFTVDPSGEHAYVDNVGSSEYEEIDQVPLDGGGLYNSGWPCIEGPEDQFLWRTLHLDVCENLYSHRGLLSAPLFDYSHDSEVLPGDQCPRGAGSAITGNAVYDGSGFPTEYDGALFFADSVRGCIWTMLSDEDGEPDPSTLRLFGSGEQGSYAGVVIENGPGGALYYSQMVGDGGNGPGSIHRISYDPGAPVARLAVDQAYGSQSHTFHFDASGSSDPDDEALGYEWDFGAGFLSGAATASHAFHDAENHTVSVRVEDETGRTSVARLTVYPGDAPPTVQITSPAPSLTWHVGQTIQFAGSARDAAGDDLRYTHLYWDTRILHCPFSPDQCHRHPLQVFPAVESGSLVAPDHDYPSYVELILTATDERGLANAATVKVKAEPVTLTLKSTPEGVPVVAGEDAGATPLAVEVIKGSHLTISAPQTYSAGESVYAFDHWSDGGERVHAVPADANATYVASYEAPTADLIVSQSWDASGGLEASFDASGSTGTGLHYAWDIGSGFGAPSAVAAIDLPVGLAGERTVRVRVTDANGASAVAEKKISVVALQLESEPVGIPLQAATVTKAAPFTLLAIQGMSVSLSAPEHEDVSGTEYHFSSWSDGQGRAHSVAAATGVYKARYVEHPDPVAVLGAPLEHWNSAGQLEAEFDASGSSGPGLQYEWDPEGDGSFESPDDQATRSIAFTDEAAHTVAVRVRDSYGSTAVASVTARAVAVRLKSDPAGVPLKAGSVERAGPFQILALAGREIQLSAPQETAVGGTAYTFGRWSDAGAISHPVTPGAATTYTAVFDPVPGPPGPPVVEPPLALLVPSLQRHPPKKTRSAVARFVLSANLAAASFRCKLDKQAFHACGAAERFRGLAPGWHVFRALAVYRGARSGVVTYRWRVLPRRGHRHRHHRH